MDKKIAIISLGWLGSALYDHLEQLGMSVLGTYFSQKKEKHSEIYFDINEGLYPQELLDRDLFIFCLPPSKISSFPFFVQFLKRVSLKQIVLISSTSVYGHQGNVNEQTKPSPESTNGEFVFEIEKAVQKYVNHHTIIRSAGQFGPGRHPGFFLQGRTNISGGNLPINLISQESLLQIITKSLKDDKKIINAVNNQHPNKREFYTDFCRKNKLSPPTFTNTLDSGKIISTIFPEYICQKSLL